MDKKIKKYHIIYQTTNLINGKIYVGKHSTNNLNDSYIGSGSLLKAAIAKYGKENFKREILEILKTAEEAYAREAELVNEEFIARSDVYNLYIGGSGSGEERGNYDRSGENNPMYGRESAMKGKTHTPEARKKISDSQKGGYRSPELRAHLSKIFSGENSPNFGRKHTEEAIQKMRDNVPKGKSHIWFCSAVYPDHFDNHCMFPLRPLANNGVRRPRTIELATGQFIEIIGVIAFFENIGISPDHALRAAKKGEFYFGYRIVL